MLRWRYRSDSGLPRHCSAGHWRAPESAPEKRVCTPHCQRRTHRGYTHQPEYASTLLHWSMQHRSSSLRMPVQLPLPVCGPPMQGSQNRVTAAGLDQTSLPAVRSRSVRPPQGTRLFAAVLYRIVSSCFRHQMPTPPCLSYQHTHPDSVPDWRGNARKTRMTGQMYFLDWQSRRPAGNSRLMRDSE